MEFIFILVIVLVFLLEPWIRDCERRQLAEYHRLMAEWRVLEERYYASSEGRVRADRWEPETREERLNRLGGA